jgi:outer membrane protein OmpA-like peptidoglycan-associated protein
MMKPRVLLLLGAVAGATLAASPAPRAQTAAQNLAPTKDEIIKDLTPAPAMAPRTRGVGQRGLGRVKPEAPQTASSEMRDSLNSTYFEFNSAQLTPFGLRVVDEYVKALKDPALSAYSFRIIGHTDAVGSDKYNDELSRRRALTVQSYLIAKGVDPAKLDTMGMGKRELKNRNNPESAENRRVVILNLGRSNQ